MLNLCVDVSFVEIRNFDLQGCNWSLIMWSLASLNWLLLVMLTVTIACLTWLLHVMLIMMIIVSCLFDLVITGDVDNDHHRLLLV